ncbi:MAG: response regulator [Polyangiaceae bacterium]|nr:response regulator [Polyangiaceae bacterium]
MSPSPTASSADRHRVLVVDDDTAMLRVLEALLGGAEMDVTSCSSGAAALRLMEARVFDIVCADFLMPDMNGLQVLKAAGHLQRDAGTVLITAAPDAVPSEDRRRFYVVAKPFDPERLIRLVDQLGRVARVKRGVRTGGQKQASPGERDSNAPPPPSSRPTPTSSRTTRASERPPASDRWQNPASDRQPPASSGRGEKKGNRY